MKILEQKFVFKNSGVNFSLNLVKPTSFPVAQVAADFISLGFAVSYYDLISKLCYRCSQKSFETTGMAITGSGSHN